MLPSWYNIGMDHEDKTEPLQMQMLEMRPRVAEENRGQAGEVSELQAAEVGYARKGEVPAGAWRLR